MQISRNVASARTRVGAETNNKPERDPQYCIVSLLSLLAHIFNSMVRCGKRRRTLPADMDGPAHERILLCNEFEKRMTFVSFFGCQDEFKQQLESVCTKWHQARQKGTCHHTAYRESLRKCVCFLNHVLCACACVLYVECPVRMIRLIEASFDDVQLIDDLRGYTYQHAKQMYLDLGGSIRALAPTPESYRLVGLKKRVESMRPSVMWRHYFKVMSRSMANMFTQSMYMHFILHANMNGETSHTFRLDNRRVLTWNERCMKWLVIGKTEYEFDSD